MSKQRISQADKERVVAEGEKEGVNEVCKRYGIHITTYYSWRRKLKANGSQGLPSKSGGHNKGKREIADWKIKEVLREKKKNRGYGTSQIRNQLRRGGITISTHSIQRILKDNGYQAKKQSGKSKEYIRFEASRPLELVQIDIMEFYIHKVRVYLLFLLDDRSRFILNFHLTDKCNIEGIQQMVETAIQRYGKFEKLLSDRGFVFHGWRGINRFEKYLEEHEIYHIHTSPHHPETIGKIERVNQSVQKELIRVKEFQSITEAVEELERWIWQYNYKRVHQGLGGVLVPAERFHGWESEIDKVLSRKVEEGLCLNGRPISLLNISMVDGKFELCFLGKTVAALSP
jgi:transposase InsO family protein